MSLNAGTRLGTYDIRGLLGAGGMGEVYRARDLRLDRDVAIKVLPAEVASNPARVARFEREARTVAGLNHPNIVTLFSVEDEDGVRFITMELVEGQTLSKMVAPGGLPFTKILEIAIPLTDALVAAHGKGIIHRDLKPGNIMVTREGWVKVLDFGLAKMMGEDAPVTDDGVTAATADTPITLEGGVVGTVPYMAPEQLRGQAADERTDLFSLGIILYELATGRRPFTGGNNAEVTASILRDRPEPPRRVRNDLPAGLDGVIVHCLEKNPRARVQRATDVLRRLQETADRREVEEPARATVASIAVLPFVNRSANADDEYFSDGLADELLNVLSKIKGLRVTARTSSFRFKGSKEDAPTIGRKLDVATLLDGSVRKAGNRIRVSVQLVNVSDNSHLWSEMYDRTLDDIFAVQDDIAQSVVKELRTTLLGEGADSDAGGAAKADVAQAARGRGSDPEALRLYLLGRHLLARYTREDTATAIGHLKEALALDPDYALAWAELGGAYGREADVGWIPVTDGYRLAREAVERALALEPDLPEGHARMGWIRAARDWDFRGAEASYARALQLSPGNAAVLVRAGAMAFTWGRLEEAIGLLSRAAEQDPLSSEAFSGLGFVLLHANRFTEAEAAFRKGLELAPQRAMAHAALAVTLVALGRGDEALTEAVREREKWASLWALAIVHHALGHRAESDAVLAELLENHAKDSALQIAEVHGARGEVDRAFEFLERAYAQRDPGLAVMKASPRLRSLHGDPRWGKFLGKMGLGE